MKDGVSDLELSLENLSLSGAMSGDYGLGFLWRNCKNVKKLQLKGCESAGDLWSFSGFAKSLNDLKELELSSCGSFLNRVLLKYAKKCVSLDSLLVHGDVCGDHLLQFINQSKCSLRSLDLSSLLDLDDTHLIALSENLNFRGLVILRLTSCYNVTADGLRVLGRAIGNQLEELALINFPAVTARSVNRFWTRFEEVEEIGLVL